MNNKNETAMWTEKYRPNDFDEVLGQDKIVKRVRAFVKQRNMPHLLFAGPAGVGKTSLALVTAKQLFKDSWNENFLELNASDERGINVVREKVKEFARSRALRDIPFKIIYLDEADALTKEAQQALRRTMENYTQTCRFILACNYSSKIIDPIQSRCTLFKFKPLPEEDVFIIIDKIARKEGFSIDDESKKALFTVSNGDCRRVENILQGCAAISKKIETKLIYELASAARPDEIKEVLNLCANGSFEKARDKLLKTMLQYGLSGIDTVKQFQANIWGLTLDNNKKLEMIKETGEIEFRMVEGSDEFIQLESLLAKFVLINSK